MAKTGRNAPCPCGSGRKYKKCCLNKDRRAERRERMPAARPATVSGAFPGDLPADLDTYSPEAWAAMEENLPADAREEFTPVIRQLQEIDTFMAKRAEIEAAEARLEAHREDYELLTRDPDAFMERTQALFTEPPFESMRFTVDDLDRAFEAVGYPPDGEGEAFMTFVGQVIDVLVTDKQRSSLARRLACIMPDYVAEDRFLDAWLIEHNIVNLTEPPGHGWVPLLSCMFMAGLRQWREARSRDEEALVDQLGLDLDGMRQKRSSGLDPTLSGLTVTDDMLTKTEDFLTEHPQLAAQMEAQCQEATKAAVDLLETEDGQSLLLDRQEVQPWLTSLAERIAADPAVAEAARTRTKLSQDILYGSSESFYKTCSDMADAIFTESRRHRLQADIDALRDRLERQGKQETLALTGASVAAGAPVPPRKSHFLVMLCSHSIMQVLEGASELM